MEPISFREFGRQYYGIAPGTVVRGKQLDMIYASYKQYNDKRIDLAAAADRPAMKPQILDVPNPDGKGSTRMAQLSNGSWQVLQEYKAPPLQMTQAEDGTIVFGDPVSGSYFRAWDKETGAPIKGAKKVDPFAGLFPNPNEVKPSGQSGAATLEPPVAAPAPMPAPAPAPQQAAPVPSPQEAPVAAAPEVYSISGPEDYAKVPAGASVSWNGQTFIKR